MDKLRRVAITSDQFSMEGVLHVVTERGIALVEDNRETLQRYDLTKNYSMKFLDPLVEITGVEFSEPTITVKEDMLKIYTLYLEKFESLSKGERNAYEIYLNMLSNPIMIINEKQES